MVNPKERQSGQIRGFFILSVIISRNITATFGMRILVESGSNSYSARSDCLLRQHIKAVVHIL